MAAPLRRLNLQTYTVRAGRLAAIGLCSLVFAVPLLLAVALALWEGSSAAAWQAMLAQPQWRSALGLSLWTATASTLLALMLTVLLGTWAQGQAGTSRLQRALAPMLAVPHAAFAIGLAWLIAPAGWLARALAPVLGYASPPQWETVNDPHGWALIAVLVLKETPFLLWSLFALLARPEHAALLARQVAVARTLGYTPLAWWARVGWAQLLPRLAWPLAAVLAYGLTVVDVALLVGPQSPPTLALLAWQALSEGRVQRNAEGAAMALLLALALAALALLGLGLHALWQAFMRRQVRRGQRAPGWLPAASRLAPALGLCILLLYGLVALALATWSLAGPWGFPALWPAQWTGQTWAQVAASAATTGFSVALAVAAAASAVLLALAWLESTPAHWDRRISLLVLLPLVLPGLFWLGGLYQLALWARLDGTVWGLWWVHVLLVLPYAMTALAPAWRSFDARLAHTALALGRSRLVFWWRVKWPLLAAPLASALAIGFAVSLAQYLATQFIGAARHPTLTTEAVTLASGGQRNLAAAFALLLALLPAVGFVLAQHVAHRSMRAHAA